MRGERRETEQTTLPGKQRQMVEAATRDCAEETRGAAVGARAGVPPLHVLTALELGPSHIFIPKDMPQVRICTGSFLNVYTDVGKDSFKIVRV